jgi:hypothetical protein
MDKVDVFEKGASHESTWIAELARLGQVDNNKAKAEEFRVVCVARSMRRSLLIGTRFGSAKGLSEFVAKAPEKSDLIPPEFSGSLLKDLNGLYGIRYAQDGAAKTKSYSE